MADIQLGSLGVKLPESFNVHTSVFVGPEEEAEPIRLAIFKKPIPFRPNVVITMAERAVEPGGLEEYVEEQIALLRPLKQFQHVDRETVTCDNGEAGVLQRHVFLNADGVKIEQLQLYVAFGETAAIATATHLAGEPFARHLEQFRGTLLTLSVKDSLH
ncbi:MAG: DcrB-related protein [Myxococcota bacterium]